MSNHTPGPWVATFDGDFGGSLIIRGSDQYALAVFDPDDLTERANAQLIAAAPELFNSVQLDHLIRTSVVNKDVDNVVQAWDFAKSIGWDLSVPINEFAKDYQLKALTKARGE